jgi:hypothetical protein
MTDWIRSKLVPEWRNWWRMYSMWCFGAIAVLAALGDHFQAVGWVLPSAWRMPAVEALAMFGAVSRVIKQVWPDAGKATVED